MISIHAPRTGSDNIGVTTTQEMLISIHAPRTGSDIYIFNVACHTQISIHAPRTGSDIPFVIVPPAASNISIHAPRTGSDVAFSDEYQYKFEFQSTLPARGATRDDGGTNTDGEYFNPRSPHGERPRTRASRTRRCYFNPRSPHGERRFGWSAPAAQGDFNPRSPHGERPDWRESNERNHHFNPRSPHGERPMHGIETDSGELISIHAPRTGSDYRRPIRCRLQYYFNPRSPHGERQDKLPVDGVCFVFQSTLPARGATRPSWLPADTDSISIHAPRTGSDLPARTLGERKEFQSTLPARGATGSLDFFHVVGNISIHAPRTGSDTARQHPDSRMAISIHAPRTGSDLPLITLYIHFAYFNPRSPHGERRQHSVQIIADFPFQSTLPARGATRDSSPSWRASAFQSTLPARGATPCHSRWHHARHFNPRSPHGERRRRRN